MSICGVALNLTHNQVHHLFILMTSLSSPVCNVVASFLVIQHHLDYHQRNNQFLAEARIELEGGIEGCNEPMPMASSSRFYGDDDVPAHDGGADLNTDPEVEVGKLNARV